MSIGTAKPSLKEQDGITHHLVDSLPVSEAFSSGQFEREALRIINESKEDLLIMVGGSGLYINALCYGLDELPDIPASVREQLNSEYKDSGIAPLQKELGEKDKVHFNVIDIRNPHRLIRALEVIRYTGQPYSSFLSHKKKTRPFNIMKFGVDMPRSEVYERINHRVDLMMEMGLLAEVKSLVKFKSENALQTVGYKELFKYLDGEISLERAVELVKRNTRRFAKRQMTFFKRDESIKWLAPNRMKDAITSELKSKGYLADSASL